MKKIHRTSILRRSFCVILTLAMLVGMVIVSSIQGQATLTRAPGEVTPFPAVNFVVPESVYLKGQLENEPTDVTWYINNNAAGAPVATTTTPQTPNTATGAAVYATVPGATNLSLTLEANGTSHTWADIAGDTSGTTWTGLDLNAAAVVFKAGAQNTSALMKWTLTATVDPAVYSMDTLTYVNYSVVYSPLYVPSAYIVDVNQQWNGFQHVAALNGLHTNFVGTQKLQGLESTDKNRLLDLAGAFDTDYAIQPGSNTTGGADNTDSPDTAQQFRIVDEPGSVIYARYWLTNTSASARTWAIGQTWSAGTNMDRGFHRDRAATVTSGTTANTYASFPVEGEQQAYRLGEETPGGARGIINVDTSRYTQFGQIPNLFITNMKLYMRRSSTGAYQGTTTVNTYNARQTGAPGSSGRTQHRNATANGTNKGAGALYRDGFGTRAIANDLFVHVQQVANAGTTSNQQQTVHMHFDVQVNRTDKGLLRSAVNTAVGTLPENLRAANYDAVLQAACLMLGSPQTLADNAQRVIDPEEGTTATYSVTGEALLALKDARTAEHVPDLAVGIATINHINNSTGENITTETMVYHFGDTITASALTGAVTAGGVGTAGEVAYVTFSDDADFGDYQYESHENVDGTTGTTGSSTAEKVAVDCEWNFYYDPIFNVEYDANAGTGTIAPTEGVLFNGTSMPAPADPNLFKNSGYTAVGWHTSPDAALEDAVNTMAEIQDLIGDIEGGETYKVYAIWELNTHIKVSFDLRGGSGATPDSRVVEIGGTYGEMPSGSTLFGNAFFGWYTEPNGGGQEITADSVVTLVDPHTLYIRWEKMSSITFATGITGIPNPERKVLIAGEEYGPLPVLERLGYTFLGWAAADGTEITETSIVPQGNQTLQALWSESQTGTVTFDPDGGDAPAPATKAVTFGIKYGTLPAGTRKGYDFDGWYTADDVKVTAASIVANQGDHTLTARWTVQTAAVSFDSRGGTAAAAKTVTFDDAYGALPTVTRTGYVFDGWYTAASGGTKITAANVVDIAGDHTLFAQWTADPAMAPKAPVLVDGDTITIRYRSRLAIYPSVIKGQNLKWSSDSELVTVDQNGNIESVQKRNLKGSTAVITAANDAGSVSLTVVVQPTIWQWIITLLAFGWLWY